MNDLNDENPYKSTEHTQPRSVDLGPEVESTLADRLGAIVLAIIVAIPVFFTTCIGGGFTLAGLGVGTRLGFSEDVLIVLSFVCLMFAIFAGVGVARWFMRRRRSNKSSDGETQ